jgi:hypothetical protein
MFITKSHFFFFQTHPPYTHFQPCLDEVQP